MYEEILSKFRKAQTERKRVVAADENNNAAESRGSVFKQHELLGFAVNRFAQRPQSAPCV
jgi:hypothetical protein